VSDRNAEITALLAELAELTALDEGSTQSFRVRAYENALHELELVRDDISTMSEKELCAIEGVGKSTAKKIREYFDTGAISKLEKLREAYPAAFRELTRIPGLGPKSLKKLRAELGVENLEDLRAAMAGQRIRELPGFGAKSEEKLAHALERIGLAGKDKRTPIADALPLAEELVARLESMAEVERAQYCGSLRRFRETVADIDIVAVATDPAPVMQAFVDAPGVTVVLGHGETKSSVVARGIQIDLRVIAPEQWGAAILYFTGSKAHNIGLRQRAIERSWTLNEYGLTHADSGEVIAQRSEEEIYQALEMSWVRPPMREGTGEIARADDDTLPRVPDADDLAGDLRVYAATDALLDEMVEAAAARGARFIAFVDRHGEGWNEPRTAAQVLERAERIEALRAQAGELTIFHAVELAIGEDGAVSCDDQVRSRIDFAIAAVESGFELEAEAQTARITAALGDPLVRVLARPTGRIIGTRDPMRCDADAVLSASVAAQVAIEIGGELDRLDAPAELLRRAAELGARFAFGSGATVPEQLSRATYAARLAQRGWVDREAVINCQPAARVGTWLRRR